METTCSIILAAGKGTRLKSARPKVLHEILAKPLVCYCLDLASLVSRNCIVVVGHGRTEVMKRLDVKGVEFVVQEPQLGTGHAVFTARDALCRVQADEVLILPGDMPLIRKESVFSLVQEFRTRRAQVGILTAVLDNPAGYGRIVRDETGGVRGIVEHADATDKELFLHEVNTSVYVMDKAFLLDAVSRLNADNAKAEFYLTDVIPMAERVASVITTEPDEAFGINSRSQLAKAQKTMQRRINARHLEEGVTLEDPECIWIGPDVAIGPDARIWPFVHILGTSSIGPGAQIMPGAWIEDSTVGREAVVGAGSILKGAVIEAHGMVAPHTTSAGT